MFVVDIQYLVCNKSVPVRIDLSYAVTACVSVADIRICLKVDREALAPWSIGIIFLDKRRMMPPAVWKMCEALYGTKGKIFGDQ